METTTTPKTSQSKRRPPSSSLESPSITSKEIKTSSLFKNASLEDKKKAINKKLQEIEDYKKARRKAEFDEVAFAESRLKLYVNKGHYKVIEDEIYVAIGSLAIPQQKTVTEVYADFGLKDED